MSRLQRRQKLERPKLLVVDDEPDNLDLLYRTFYRDYTVLRAENGHTALEILEKQPDVAVIVSDQRMPGMSGTEFLRQTAVEHPNIMRIILTGYTDVGDLVKAINEGKVFKYVTKPWEIEQLKSVVKQALDTHLVLRSRTEELQRILQQETMLNNVTNTIRGAETAQEMMQTIVKTIGTLMEVDLCLLHPYQDAALAVEQTLYVNPNVAIAAEDLAKWSPHLTSMVVEATELTPEKLASRPDLAGFQAASHTFNIQSTLLIPLVDKQQLMAVLSLHQLGQPRDWQENEVQLLATTADQAALALSQMITYERVQALARREKLLNTVTQAIRSSLEPQAIFAAITRELGQALHVDSCVLSLWTAQDAYMQCVGLFENQPTSAAGVVSTSAAASPPPKQLPKSRAPISSNPVLMKLLEARQPIAVNDLNQHPEMGIQEQPTQLETRSLLVVPLIAEGEIIGSISLRHVYQPHPWSHDEVSLAQAVAAQAAIAVQQSRLYQKTREQTEQLIALDHQKTEFFQTISHEFRTPLTLTLGPLESAVSQGQGLDYEQSEVALRNARRLLRLVNQLLDLQRLDAGRMQPTFRPVDPTVFVDEIVSAFRLYCDRKGLSLVADLSPCPTLYLDLEKFDKVLYNLLSNAVKFTPKGGTITVKLEAQETHCIVSVQDSGIGIREDQLPLLFERFRQADGSANRRYEGTGLGLALVKELVTLHHGQLEVSSVYGEGSTFRVLVPTGRHHLPDEHVIDTTASAEVSRAAVELSDIVTVTPAAEPQLSSDSLLAAGETETRILVVDDNADLLRYISNVLQRQGYHVRTAHRAEAALEMMQTYTPHLILSDLMMPGMSGLELIQKIRESDRLSRTPVVLLTAKVDDETRIEGVEQGADAYLGKPFNDRELLAEVRNLIALKANERRVEELNQYLTKSVLRRFLPASLVDKAASGDLQIDLQPEPRLITVLFSDIVGFTPLSNQLGPRRLAQILNEYLGAMTEAIFACGGTVDKFMGDGVLALFGSPEDLPPAEQAHRALAAARKMHQTLAQLNQRWQDQGIPEIKVRYGIHQGDAVVGLFGSAVRSDYTAIGPCVNIASRLQEVAEPNGVLVSWRLAQYLPEHDLSGERAILLRGLNIPTKVYDVHLNQTMNA